MKVMAFGTFDIVHDGHRFFLTEARKNGDYLVVVVGTDVNVAKIKGRKPVHNASERVKNVESMKIADKVILGSETDFMMLIDEHKPDIICLGYDQSDHGLSKKINKKGIFINRIHAFKPDVCKSSLLRDKV